MIHDLKDNSDNWACKYQAAMQYAEQEILKETISNTQREQRYYDFPSQMTSLHGHVQFSNSVHNIQEELYSKDLYSKDETFPNPNDLYVE